MLLDLRKLNALYWVWLQHAIYQVTNLFANLIGQEVATFLNFLEQNWH
jgi:hypothetical protein